MKLETMINSRRINSDTIQFGIGTVMPGQIWKIKLTNREEKETVGTNASLTKPRPYLVVAVSNSNVEVIPITSNNPINDTYYIKTPRIDQINDPTSSEVNFIAVSKTRVVGIEAFSTEDAKYLAMVSPQLLKHCVSVLIAYRYLTYFDNDEMSKIVNDAIDYNSSLANYTFISSHYKKYVDDDYSTFDSEDIECELTTV